MNTQIIATVGPSSDNYDVLKDMTIAGMTIVRINFSHGNYGQWERIRGYLSKIKEETGISVKMMLDLQGPRIRVGNFVSSIDIQKGDIFSFFYGKADLSKKEIPIDNGNIYKDIKEGDPFYLANGLIEFKILEVKDKKIVGIAVKGGGLLPRKGINIPQTNLSKDVITKKDIDDAEFGSKNGADFICLSFVQEAQDIKKLRKIINNDKISVIAKIERRSALNNIDTIARCSDGLMVARGDLGIEVPIEDLPIIQKELIKRAHFYKKPAIVATEMLFSMMNKPTPTRAEVCDVANAIWEKADAVMLSDETSAGLYPIESIETMKKVVKKAEKYVYKNELNVI